MNVLSIYRGPDTGGWGYRMGQAFARHTDWTFHSMYVPNAFEWIEYPHDLAWDAKLGQILYDAADVVHLHNNFGTAQLFERNRKRKEATVIHYHGTAFRQNPKAHLAQQAQRPTIAIVSTLDLQLIAPDQLEWLPSPYNLEWLDGLRS